MNILEMKEKQKKLWEEAKNFLDSHTAKDGTLSAEDAKVHDKILKDFDALTENIKRFQLEGLEKSYPATKNFHSRPASQF